MEALAYLLADPTSGAPAIIAESGAIVLSYRALTDQIERVAETLSHTGLVPGDAVALVLPNGPELVILILAIARAGLIAVPLDPGSKTDEMRGFIEDADARAVVANRGDGAVERAATACGVPTWTSSLTPSGELRLVGMPSEARGALGSPNAGDVALYLHTSGTEGRPKVVPLTHANVILSAQHIAHHYALTPADRSLAVLPFFHGHGLIGVALATLASGGALIVPPRFSASRFWETFRQYRATWYSAVPTIHQILLGRADADNAPASGARFIRSCSAPLAPAIMARIEQRFGAPVIEAYGLTEAAHQVASNPLPPLARRTGSVGGAVGVEIAVIDTNGRHLGSGAPGQVVVRGPSVMSGYRNNADATAAAFVDGWLRTGDAGMLDADGYLTLTGRLKEMINRGGEKISPVEIDHVLLEHPAVAEAAAFGVPDPKYGEEVEAAVVLKGEATPEGLRVFCRERLADFKVPKVIRIVSALPRSAMGKVNRRSLAVLYPLAS